MRKLMILVLVLCFVGSASAAVLAVRPTDDNWVRSHLPDSVMPDNWGNGGWYGPDSGSDYYFKFDLSGIPSGQTIDSATLMVKTFNNYATDNHITVSLYGVADDTWDEGTITWNNKPTIGSLLTTFISEAQGIGDTHHASGETQQDYLDVGTYVAAQYTGNGGNDLASFELDSPGEAVWLRNDDWSGDQELEHPYLELSVTYTPEPMTIALLGLGGLFLRKRKRK